MTMLLPAKPTEQAQRKIAYQLSLATNQSLNITLLSSHFISILTIIIVILIKIAITITIRQSVGLSALTERQ